MGFSKFLNFVLLFISTQLAVVEADTLHDTVIGLFVGISIAFIMLVSAIAISCKVFVCVKRSSQGTVLQPHTQTTMQQTSLMSSNSPHSLTNPAYNVGGNNVQV